MVKLVDKQSSFNSGILTAKLRGRDDLNQYTNAVGDALNFYASKYGPIIKRVGTEFKWNAGSVGTKVRLVPFVYSINQCVILEFLPNKIRFYTFQGTEFGPIADPSNPSKQYEISTPFTASQLEGLSYAQSLDIIYIAVPGGKTRPKELRRYANDNWQLIDYTFEDGPYLDQNFDDAKTVQISTTSRGTANITISGFTFRSTDVGRHVRVNHTDPDTDEERWGWGEITAVADTHHATINMKQKAWSTDATSDFRLGAWCDRTGWPTIVHIHEQRLVWSGVTNYPWLWMSNSFNYNNFAPSTFSGVVKDSNAIYYNMSTDKVSEVSWLSTLTGALLIGTEMYEMRMYASGAGLAPGDCVVRKESTYGAHKTLPLMIDDTLVFVQRLQRKLRAIAYDYARDAYVGPDLSTLAESLTVAGIKKIVGQREPFDLIWCLMEDGSLKTVTYDKDQSVVGWTRVALGGADVKVVDIVTVPSNTLRQDIVLLWVERNVNGIMRRYVEMLAPEFQDNIKLPDVPFVDCAMRYQGPSTTAIDGLSHLNGETVLVMNRGALRQESKVANGRVEFDYPITDGWIGLPYSAHFETLERDFGEKTMSTKMAKVRIHRMVLYLLRTLGLTVTQQVRGMTTQLLTFSPQSKMDTPPEPLSGEYEHDIMTAWTSYDLHYILRFDSDPGMPCTVAGIYTGIELNAL